MVKCTHKGCGKDFVEAENKDNGIYIKSFKGKKKKKKSNENIENIILACQYHEGAPVFHEGKESNLCNLISMNQVN